VEVYLDFSPALSWSVGLGILCSSTFLQIRRITHVGIQKPMTKEVLKSNEVIFASDLILVEVFFRKRRGFLLSVLVYPRPL
jgi:hypothetical protein